MGCSFCKPDQEDADERPGTDHWRRGGALAKLNTEPAEESRTSRSTPPPPSTDSARTPRQHRSPKVTPRSPKRAPTDGDFLITQSQNSNPAVLEPPSAITDTKDSAVVLEPSSAVADTEDSLAAAGNEETKANTTDVTPRPSVTATRRASTTSLDKFSRSGSMLSLVAQKDESQVTDADQLWNTKPWTLRHEKGAAANPENVAMLLHYACEQGKADLVKQLLDNGADVDLVIEQNGQEDDETLPLTPLERACLEGKTEVVQVLLDHGATADPPALHLASQHGFSDTVELLLKNWADVSSLDDNEVTALHWAAQQGHLDVVRLLLDAGADPNAQGQHGAAPLHLAVIAGQTAAAELMLARGADVGRRAGVVQGTVLHWACQQDSPEVIDLLLSKCADLLEAKDEDGATALHWAAQFGHVHAAEALLKHGASVTSKDGQGFTPLELAAADQGAAMTDLLKGKGSKGQEDRRLSDPSGQCGLQ